MSVPKLIYVSVCDKVEQQCDPKLATINIMQLLRTCFFLYSVTTPVCILFKLSQINSEIDPDQDLL